MKDGSQLAEKSDKHAFLVIIFRVKQAVKGDVRTSQDHAHKRGTQGGEKGTWQGSFQIVSRKEYHAYTLSCRTQGLAAVTTPPLLVIRQHSADS